MYHPKSNFGIMPKTTQLLVIPRKGLNMPRWARSGLIFSGVYLVLIFLLSITGGWVLLALLPLAWLLNIVGLKGVFDPFLVLFLGLYVAFLLGALFGLLTSKKKSRRFFGRHVERTPRGACKHCGSTMNHSTAIRCIACGHPL